MSVNMCADAKESRTASAVSQRDHLPATLSNRICMAGKAGQRRMREGKSSIRSRIIRHSSNPTNPHFSTTYITSAIVIAPSPSKSGKAIRTLAGAGVYVG